MPPLLFLLVMIVSTGMSTAFESQVAREKAEAFLEQQAANLIGNKAAAAEIGNIIGNSERQPGVWWKSALSLLGVLVGATGLVGALQAALNHVWGVKPSSGSFAIHFFLKRLFSLAMILSFGFLLLVSFLISTLLSMLSDYLAMRLGIGGGLPGVINHGVSFLTSWMFFTLILRFMPDAKIQWRHAAVGGFVTVILFTLGRVALYYYLSLSDPAEKLGSAAASLIVILLWVYYSSISLLFGAEFTSNLDPDETAPEAGAVQITEVTQAE